MMKFLVIKHLIVEGLGIFEQFCHEAGIAIDTVELEKGDSFPDLTGYSALWVMGGSMNAEDEADYPWLIEEKALIRQAIELNLPYVGICLGAQLLADALGGEVGFMQAPEVGVFPVTLTEAGRLHPLMQGLPDTLEVLEWHGQEVKRLPLGATRLAASVRCPVQAYAVGEYAFGLQFHNEVSGAAVKRWAEIPEYCADLEKALGPTGCADLTNAVEAKLSTMNDEARIMFNNFLKLVKQRWQQVD